jgi:hypothetical protein
MERLFAVGAGSPRFKSGAAKATSVAAPADIKSVEGQEPLVDDRST